MPWRRPEGAWLRLRGPQARLALVAVLLVAVGALRVAFRAPSAVGVSFLSLIPVLLAARWFGTRGGVLVGALGAGLYALQVGIGDEDLLLSAALLRLVLFVTVGYVFARLTERDRRSTTELARRQSEMEELRVIREVLVPAALPELPGLDLSAAYVPAEQGVGGDFYLVSGGPAGETVVVVGDAVGKGLDAARQASFVRATLAAYAPFTRDPGRLLGMVNRSLLEREDAVDTFVTAACVAVDPREQSVSWALAGHPPPRWLDDGGELVGGTPGLPLGVDPELGCATAHAELKLGSGISSPTASPRRGGAGRARTETGVRCSARRALPHA